MCDNKCVSVATVMANKTELVNIDRHTDHQDYYVFFYFICENSTQFIGNVMSYNMWYRRMFVKYLFPL